VKGSKKNQGLPHDRSLAGKGESAYSLPAMRGEIQQRRFRPSVCVLSCVATLAVGPVLAASGRVVDPTGKPIEGARACLLVAGAEGLCSITDTSGYYDLPDTEVPWLRIVAKGFLPKRLSAVDQEVPVTLDRAASLRVRLLDRATGAPIQKGQVFVIYSSGRKKGPFPTNAAGVRVSTLEPGEVVVQGMAADHADDRSDTVRLQGGTESELVLRLPAAPKAP
jgi:hypothetical protein